MLHPFFLRLPFRPALSRTALAAAVLAAASGGCKPAGAEGDFLARLRSAGLPRRIEPLVSIAPAHLNCGRPPVGDAAAVPGALCDPVLDDREVRARVLGIQVAARRASHERVDPGAMHADALVDLLWTLDDPARADRVVDELEAVARLTPSADVLGDLSAAYLVRAGAADRPADLVAAIDAAHRALQRDPSHAAARFNAALAEQRLGLDRVAAEDWDAFLARAPSGGWAAEARRRRSALDLAGPPIPDVLHADTAALARFAAAAPQQAREAAQERLLPAWAAAVLEGRADTAEDRLGRAEVLGAALLRRPGGDASAADLAGGARASGGRAQARAIADLGAAYDALRQRRFQEAEAAFARAEREAGTAGPLRDWCAYGRGVGRYYRGLGDEGDSIFTALAVRVDSGRYPVLAGRVRRSLTTLLGRKGRFVEAMEQADRAERLLRAAGEVENAAFAHGLGSEAAWNLGDADGSARRMYRVLHDLRRSPYATSRHNQLYVGAQAARAAGLLHAAARLLDDDVAATAGAGPSLRVEPFLWRAEARAALGWRALARADLAAGALLLDSLPDPQNREWNRQDQRIAAVGLDDRPGAATLARMDSVVAFFDDPKRSVRLVPALLGRARVRLSLGDATGARADLDSVSRVLDRRSGQMRSVVLRASMLEASRAVFEQLAMLSVRANRPELALAALERGRAQLHARPAGNGAPRSAPRGTVVASLSLIGDTLLVGTLEGGRVRLAVDTVPGGSLARMIDALATGLEVGVKQAETDRLLARLHGVLVTRMGTLPRGAELVVVADGILGRVPFAALREPASGRYLVQDHAVRYAATLADAIAPRPRAAPPDRPTLVVAPSFDRARHPTLEPLPAAEAEAREIAAADPHGVLLAGAQATRSRVRAALAGAALVHVAGHAVFNDAQPSRSYLVLAPSKEGDELRADQIDSLDLRGVRLVVLASCRTQRASGHVGGMTGLTAAAMGAGADGVVGSLWRVEDTPTRALMTVLHRAYRASGDPSAALRAAQLTLLASRDPGLRSPAAWAGFRYAGR